MKYENVKIVLAGAQGAGKTTLMTEWSKKHKCSVLQKTATRLYFPKNVKNHLDIIKLASIKPKKGIKFQEKLIKTKYKLLKSATGGFITDRSIFDSYVYYAITNSPFSTPEKDNKLKIKTYKSLKLTDLIVILNPRIAFNIKNDNVRLTSPSYYSIFFPILNSTIKEFYDEMVTTHRIFYVDNSETCATLTIPENRKFSAILTLDEFNSPQGIFTTETRIKLIEKAINSLEY